MAVFDLSGKRVIVTGGGSGIGLAIAIAMAKSGANVVITGRKMERLEKASVTIKAAVPTCEVHCITCDVSNKESCENMVKQAIALGNVFVLCSNAGTTVDNLYEPSDESWESIIATELSGNIYLANAITPYFKEQYEKQKHLDTLDSSLHVGAFIVTSGISAFCGIAHSAVATGMNGFVKALAAQYAPIRVTVNSIQPGPIPTEIAEIARQTNAPEMTFQEYFDTYVEQIPMHRGVTAEEIGKLAVFMACMPNLTAQPIAVDGGYLYRS